MKVRLFGVMLAVLALSGCATTQQKAAPANQLQNQVVDLQQRMEEQEKEIVDLKYEVKDLTAKVQIKEQKAEERSLPVVTVSKSDAKNDSDSIVRVAVAPSEIQKALKAAGLYEGAIDGKIGSRTKAAVIEFQKKHNLKADGVIGQKTWAEMKTYLNQ